MKKILTTLVVLCAVLSVSPVCGCSQSNSTSMTGGACSISDINNLEKAKTTQGKIGSEPKVEVGLRPVKNTSEVRINKDKTCLFGECLYKSILGR